MRVIELVGKENLSTLVDDDDFAWLSPYSWYSKIGGGGFYAARVDRSDILMHREILGLKKGDGFLSDHKNGDTLNNQRSNLRIANHEQNMRNRKRAKNNSTGYKGVCRIGGRFRAAIKAGGKTVNLGTFTSVVVAAVFYDMAAKRLHGEFARLNFPGGLP